MHIKAARHRFKLASKTMLKMNAMAKERNRQPKPVFKSWKEQIKHEGQKASQIFFIDFEKDRRPLSWFDIYTNLLNP